MQGLVSVLTQQLETERKDSHSLSAACDAAKAQVEELKAKLAGVLQCVAVCYSVLQTKNASTLNCVCVCVCECVRACACARERERERELSASV